MADSSLPPMPPPDPAHEMGVAPTKPVAVSNGRRFVEFLLELLLMIVTLVIGWLIWSVLIWNRGLTPAKQVMGMKCVDPDTGETVDWGKMALREIVGKWLIGLIVPFWTLINGLVILFSSSRRGLWDYLPGTVVVDA